MLRKDDEDEVNTYPHLSSTSGNPPSIRIMSTLTTQASIGIGVPLGVILLFVVGGITWANLAKKKRNLGDLELTTKPVEDPNAPKPREIKWSPWG
ncbi:hypothetical protein P280DRAFT_550640 [Massarina eburnea CBS 473.64]|uniref:Uncharacterized protein n=1 Tax=Massarina eburnea CBS 473.64 TaxID=1395130 RepID=A0A6A6RZ07_9PLEO|nr:hypothetical protein P280DRAFT_550640 [Massarina eburnea CBS 473.64]